MNVSAVTASAVYLPMQALAPSVPGAPLAPNLAKAPEPATAAKIAPGAAASKETSSSASRSLAGSPRQDGKPAVPIDLHPTGAGWKREKVDVYA